ncbi:MAG: nickel pincer cofactor biosynthesis protein LarB [Candidatus Dormibacteria bacterium]
MKDILERLLAGEFSVDEALALLEVDHVAMVGDLGRLDPDRRRRTGVPEVINAGPKSPTDTATLALAMVGSAGSALVSRVGPGHDLALRDAAAAAGMVVDVYGSGRRLRPEGPAPVIPEGIPGVGILAAGSSDVDVAEEARMVIEGMGVPCGYAYDVGVSALHRLEGPLRSMLGHGAEAFVVVAGMEGALPTVVGGLVGRPVIAVPTSTGYGAGGHGLAALLAMLQSCAPGVTVVNIDNGVGAGAAAGLVALRVGAR